MDTHTPLPTHYTSSRGKLEIATMAYPHIVNAIAKLERDGATDQMDVLYALRARKTTMDIEQAAAQPETPQAAPEAPAPRLGGIGDNGGPSPFDEVKTALDDLHIEARNWCDGAEVKSQAEADELSRLLEKVRAVAKRADAERIKEKEPHDDAVKEIQDRYNSLIGKTKTVTGVAVRIEEAVKTALSGWLRKVAAEQEAVRQEAARIAREAQQAAETAIAHTHDTTDLDDREAALAEVDKARQAAMDLAAANCARPQAQGEVRAIGLRTYYTPVIDDLKAALAHYWRDRPEAFRELVLQFAKDDIRVGKRSGIPGVTVIEEQRV